LESEAVLFQPPKNAIRIGWMKSGVCLFASYAAPNGQNGHQKEKTKVIWFWCLGTCRVLRRMGEVRFEHERGK
jgi:hypothetical protein